MVPFGNRNFFSCELCMLLLFQNSGDKVMSVGSEAGVGTRSPSRQVSQTSPTSSPNLYAQYSLYFPSLFLSKIEILLALH